jgi:putative DNA primase/helicase
VPTTGNTTEAGPFATAARLYRAAGWHGTLPLGREAGKKWPPPGGFTGHGSPDPSGADVEAWIETHGDRNIGLRLPQGVIGLDVDAYEKDGKVKAGGEALAALEAELGPLPPTWVSSARPAPSGIRFYRVPLELDGRPINWPGEAAKGIEIIQHGHRYAVAWPSTNPEADGATYRWRNHADVALLGSAVPHVAELAELPEAWVRGLALSYARTDKTELGQDGMAAWWSMLRLGAPCARVGAALQRAREELVLGQAGRHETARDSARTLAAYGGEGHRGVPEALTELGQVFAEAVAAPGRDAAGEWHRLLAGAVELAAADNPSPRPMCACEPPSVSIAAPPALADMAVPVPKVDEPVEAETLTDAQLVQRVHDELLEGRYLWSEGLGWLAWDGTRWRERTEETVVEAVRLWAVRFVEGQVANPYIGAVRETRTLLIGLLSKYRLTAIVGLARGLCQVDPAAFDAHPDLLNTPSGIVNLRTGELAPHDPVMRFTRITAVAYDPGAEHQDWAVALGAVPGPVATWLQVRFGQSITGHMTPDDVLLLLRGGGENGKSTLLNAIKAALGGYATYVSDRVLLADPGSHPTELMDFRGARFAVTEELPDEARLNVKRLKDVVGTPVMKARRMRKDPVEFAATHSLFLSTNHVPVVTDTDHGTWRRLALVQFPYRYVKPGDPVDEARGERRGDEGLRDRLKDGQAQREAVLRWLVAGAVRWYAEGMPRHPESVLADTQAWREKSDPIEGFWAERLRPDPDSFITSADMTAAFNEYLQSVGQHAWSDRRFIPAFGDHVRTKSHAVHWERRRVKAEHSRSYRSGAGPSLSPFVPEPTAVGSIVRAWWGVRFVNHTDPEL